MAFNTCSFTYAGTSSESHGVIYYEIGNTTQSSSVVNDGFKVVSDHVQRRYRPIYYGVERSDHLEFDMVFGFEEPVTRAKAIEIYGWLLGRQRYEYLRFDEAGMENYYYRAIITRVSVVENNRQPVAFSAHVVCDSPYAYKDLIVNNVSGGGTYSIVNDSSANEIVGLMVTGTIHASSDCKIDISASGQATQTLSFEFGGENNDDIVFSIDGDTRTILAYYDDGADTKVNLYRHMKLNGEDHFVFPKLSLGESTINVTGNVDLTIYARIPMAIGN